MYGSDGSRSSSSESQEGTTLLDQLLNYPILENLFQRLSTRVYKPYKNVIKPTLSRFSILDTSSDILKYNKIYVREGKTENTIGYLMTLSNDSQVAEIYNDYGIEGSTEVTNMRYPPSMVQFLRYRSYTAYDLLWYINNTTSTSPKDLLLTREEIGMLFTLSKDALYTLISYTGQYTGPINEACMLFSLMFGIQLPYIEPHIQYSYPNVGPMEIWISADKVHGITANYNNLYGPYLYCSTLLVTNIDRLLFKVNNRNIDSYIQEYAIIVPNNVDNKPKYVLEELSRYEPILYRPKHIQFPPLLQDKFELAKKQLEVFTTSEIIAFYQVPTTGWNNFEELVQVIINKIYGKPQVKR